VNHLAVPDVDPVMQIAGAAGHEVGTDRRFGIQHGIFGMRRGPMNHRQLLGPAAAVRKNRPSAAKHVASFHVSSIDSGAARNNQHGLSLLSDASPCRKFPTGRAISADSRHGRLRRPDAAPPRFQACRSARADGVR
jgi:hypothetical protein